MVRSTNDLDGSRQLKFIDVAMLDVDPRRPLSRFNPSPCLIIINQAITQARILFDTFTAAGASVKLWEVRDDTAFQEILRNGEVYFTLLFILKLAETEFRIFSFFLKCII